MNEQDMNSPFLNGLVAGYARCGIRAEKLLVAVSGGADSVALLLGSFAISQQLGISLVAAYFDHQLRGKESIADGDWVENLCDSEEIPFSRAAADVRNIASTEMMTTEEAARMARYQFLESEANRYSCSAIAVGHTSDDQVETILHHMIRGTGLAGLSGMPFRRSLSSGVKLIRPMLEISRSQVEQYLAERNQDYRHDETNLTGEYTRNRIRQELLPLLVQDYNRNVHSALKRLAQQAADSQEIIQQFATSVLEKAHLERQEDFCILDRSCLETHSRPVIRAILVELWRQQDWPRKRMGFSHWDRLADLVFDGGAMDLPEGVHARCRRSRLILQRNH